MPSSPMFVALEADLFAFQRYKTGLAFWLRQQFELLPCEELLWLYLVVCFFNYSCLVEASTAARILRDGS